jgi:lipopolysaccharide transport system ATP-binding protein
MSSEATVTAALPVETPKPPAEDDVIIAARGLSKAYEIYAKPVDRLKQTLWRGKRQFYREFWALRDISFQLRRGESLGIIGRNGSGKSTLLQIVAGTLRPTAGEVQVRGRVAALLELGSGFNPEFTGQENVYLNGAILGLTRADIDERFDEIASFADIGDFLTLPVKTYSTGMLVRLAFAVQAVLEPDLLIIDEALSVGDAGFQIKCMKRMHTLLERGVSVVLVTHEVNSVRSFCTQAMWLDGGKIARLGPPLDVTTSYMRFLFGDGATSPAGALAELKASHAPSPKPAGDCDAPAERMLNDLCARPDLVRWGSGEIIVTGVSLDTGQAGEAAVFEHGQRLHLEVEIRTERAVDCDAIGLGFCFRNTKGLDIITFTTWETGDRLAPPPPGGKVRLVSELDCILAPGDYALVAAVEEVREDNSRRYFDYVENALLFRVVAERPFFSMVLPAVRHEFRVLTP